MRVQLLTVKLSLLPYMCFKLTVSGVHYTDQPESKIDVPICHNKPRLPRVIFYVAIELYETTYITYQV